MKKLFIFAVAALGMLACTGGHNDPELEKVEGALPGKFSVSANTKVQFSQGNLQYHDSTNTWRFAENQWMIIANATYDKAISESGWTDYIKWGMGDESAQDGNNFSENKKFTEWGNNVISNGGNKANMWRTLTADEWLYLLHGRTNAEELFALGTVNDIPGLIILPDSWITPSNLFFCPSTEKGLTWGHEIDLGSNGIIDGYSIVDQENHYLDNNYSSSEWSIMETAGAVFLPAAGEDFNGTAYNVKEGGIYWSSDDSRNCLSFGVMNPMTRQTGVAPNGPSGFSSQGNSVRLVR
ncbi:MAG: hypothetical protein IKP11_04845 [Paludibacteraceae bacterium]|nr:hypothetical protein [Paludibacteraceae bacterium]